MNEALREWVRADFRQSDWCPSGIIRYLPGAYSGDRGRIWVTGSANAYLKEYNSIS